MPFSTYATPAVYTEPVAVAILEPSPEGMEKTETNRYETEYVPLLSAHLNNQMPISEPFMFGPGDHSAGFYLAFLIVSSIGAFYIYAFMKAMFKK